MIRRALNTGKRACPEELGDEAPRRRDAVVRKIYVAGEPPRWMRALIIRSAGSIMFGYMLNIVAAAGVAWTLPVPTVIMRAAVLRPEHEVESPAPPDRRAAVDRGSLAAGEAFQVPRKPGGVAVATPTRRKWFKLTSGGPPMQRAVPIRRRAARILGLIAVGLVASPAAAQRAAIDTPNPAGVLRTITLDGGPLDLDNPFFQSLGTNGRSCASCHVASAGWTITPAEVQAAGSARPTGLDPIFRTNDGSNSPRADVSTVEARRAAYSMLLTKGADPRRPADPGGRRVRAGRASTTRTATPAPPSSRCSAGRCRRRTSASSPAVMWDGRESFGPLGHRPRSVPTRRRRQNAVALFDDLKHQATDATRGHAAGARPAGRRRGGGHRATSS